MVNRLLVGLFTNGHILLEGVPGLAKTLTISTVANVLHLDFQRIQFTPDLLPSDLVGTMIYNQKEGQFEGKEAADFRQHYFGRWDKPLARKGAKRATGNHARKPSPLVRHRSSWISHSSC